MLIIEYTPDDRSFGNAVPDGSVNNRVDEIVRLGTLQDYKGFMHNGEDIKLSYSTQNIIYGLRVAVKQGRLDYHNIMFRFRGKDYELDKDARFPRDFGDDHRGFFPDDQWLMALL